MVRGAAPEVPLLLQLHCRVHPHLATVSQALQACPALLQPLSQVVLLEPALEALLVLVLALLMAAAALVPHWHRNGSHGWPRRHNLV